ncbi:MAG TPA: amino acid adenylation domain-containing protein [Pyrinomonadaceae bacterium]|nr:amino acid adenylation domain-containing protein [Pyrinomonadaceae bacterium]
MQERVSNPNGTHASGVPQPARLDFANSPSETCVPSNAKRALLEKLLSGDIDAEPTPARTINRRSSATAPQLSFSQERLWFLDQLMPGSPVFNVPISVPVSGALDQAILQRCVEEIVRRHEVFRTRFLTVDGKPIPVISDALATLETIDLTSLAESEQTVECRRLAKAESLRPFDLECAPLIRTTLIRLNDETSIFLLTMHHIVSDGSSILIFFRELSALYRAFSKGEVSPLAELRVQYADYALWQRDWLQGEVLERQLSYWRNQLAGELPVLDLPADRPRPAVQTYPGDRVTVVLPAELTAALTELSQREGATLFMTLLAAFKILLQRHTGQEDIIVGSPMANRPQTETEGLIGFFLNNLALRDDLSRDPDFRQLLARVRKTALDAYANQDVPFERLIGELKPERDLSRTSIFQVYFNLFSFSDQIDLPDGETVSFVDAWLQSEEDLSKFDLTLYAGVGAKEIKLAFAYNTDLFARSRMEQMADQFRHLLSQIVARPDEKISRFSLVTPRAENVLPKPTQTLADHREKPIHELFSEQAQLHPDKTAVEDTRESLSYRELDTRSNRLANYLRAGGIRTGDVVAIYGHRSVSLVWAILAVLKAGAVFLILDPDYPVERLMSCLEIAGPRGWLQLEAAGLLPEVLDRFVETLDLCRLALPTQADLLAGYSIEPPRTNIGADDLAYIAFTSGSSGKPKGVMGRHGPLTLFTSWAKDKFGLNEGERFCMLSGLAHDPLHRDVFTPLQLGGTVCIPDQKDIESPVRLRAWMKQKKVTVANLTPAMSQLLSEGTTDAEQIESLRYSFLVGDVLTKRDVARLRKLAPKITCVNLYGSTETQRAVGHFVVPNTSDEAPAFDKQVLPLGRGIRDVQLLVLNREQQMCGIGEPGEIYFRSPHLAKGYLGDATLTSERFIQNPFSNEAKDRLYRTGDLGRYLPDGNVEHLGRADRQVKIRGFRIEPAEIEAVLTKHPDVHETAVIAQRNDSDETCLVAYVVGDQQIASSMLRDYVGARLPVYMVPSAFVMLEALPLTPNGKLDRAALPRPDQIQAERRVDYTGDYTAPRSATERALAEVWQDVLSLDRIDIHENFFELGGHSLMAVRLFAEMEKRFGRRLPLATLFQAPTIAQLAALLKDDSTPQWSSLVPIQPLGSRPPFFCVHAVGGNVLEYYDLARHLGSDQPFYAFQSRGLDGAQTPHTRIEDMAAHYVKELREFQPEGPYFIGGRSLGGMIAFEMARQLNAQGQEIGLLALLDSYPVGHAKLTAQRDSSKSELRHYLRKVGAHISNMSTLSLTEKVGYLIDKSQYLPIRIKSRIWRTIYRSYQSLGQEVPRALRDVEEFNWLAAREYTPHFYDGQITLFWASKDLRAKFDLLEGWQSLALGGMEVHEVPGTHLDMIKEPHVEELAKKVDQCLLRAQQNDRRATSQSTPQPTSNHSHVREHRAA